MNKTVIIIEWIIAFLVAAYCILTLTQVVARYIFNSPFTWTEEISRYLFIWSIMLAIGIGIRKGIHIGFDLILNRLKGTAANIIIIVNTALIGFFGAYIVLHGIKLIIAGGNIKTSGIRLPYGYIYAAVPLGGLLIFIFSIEKLLQMFMHNKREKI
jgi:TRAP-type C4-dicarboxylate transport system permease small subunit